MSQTSIQLDPEWRKMLDDLAAKWGVKGATKVLRSCTEKVHAVECWQPSNHGTIITSQDVGTNIRLQP